MFVIIVQLDDFEIQQHYDEFFEEVYVEMEKVGTCCPFTLFFVNGIENNRITHCMEPTIRKQLVTNSNIKGTIHSFSCKL